MPEEEMIHVRLSYKDICNIGQGGTKEQIQAKFSALGFDSRRPMWSSVDPLTGDIWYHGLKATPDTEPAD